MGREIKADKRKMLKGNKNIVIVTKTARIFRQLKIVVFGNLLMCIVMPTQATENNDLISSNFIIYIRSM